MQGVKKRGRTTTVRLAVGLSAASLATHASAFDPPKGEPTLCRAGEAELFTCPLHRKVVSVCGLRKGGAVYRFGRPGHVELEAGGLHKADAGYSGGGEDQIDLAVRNYTYVVYTRTVRTGFSADGRNDPRFTSGLAVLKDGEPVSSTSCGGPGDQPIEAASERFMPAGKFIEH